MKVISLLANSSKNQIKIKQALTRVKGQYGLMEEILNFKKNIVNHNLKNT